MNDATGTTRPASARVHIDGHLGLIHAPSLERADARAVFDIEGEIQTGRGRGAIRRIDAACGRVVVRHYQRGGIIAKFSRDLFLWTGADATRPFREFRITQHLAEIGLPVPEVVAARYQRHGLGYRADLATREIAGACTLAERLAQGDASIDWAGLGTLIARFHAAGLWHADLNAHNVLYDAAGRVWLIDFDRARIVAPFATQLAGNLDRLARSLRKLGHGALVAGASWTTFHRAYDQAVQASVAAR